jgi:hypothetical protein
MTEEPLTVRIGYSCPGRLVVRKGSALVNSSIIDEPEIQAAVRISSGDIRQTDVVQKEFNV